MTGYLFRLPVCSLLSTRQGQRFGVLFGFWGRFFPPFLSYGKLSLSGKVRQDGVHDNASPLYNHTVCMPDEKER